MDDQIKRIGSIDLVDLQTRSANLRAQLGEVWDILIDRGWWSYVTDFPLLDFDLIIIWLTEKGWRQRVSVHFLFNEKVGLWEVILAYREDVYLTFPIRQGDAGELHDHISEVI